MIGQRIPRVDAPQKVTGTATYSADVWTAGQPLYGCIAGASIGHGRVTRIDTARAEASPGVRLVMTHRNAPPQGTIELGVTWQYRRALPTLSNAEIRHFGDPIALVVAETPEQARAAAAMIEATYERGDGHFDFAARLQTAAYPGPRIEAAFFDTDTAVGDFDRAFAEAAVTLDQVYTTPYEFSQPMEPHATLAVWNGDEVTVYVSTQVTEYAQARIASTVGIDPAKVKIDTRFVGGGFGSKLGVHADAILAVLAARELARPVKIVMTRQQTFHLVGHRPASHQHVRLGASRDGKLTAMAHEVVLKGSYHSDYAEPMAEPTRGLYAAPHRRTSHRVVALHVPGGEDVRAPGDAPGSLALETAMDELAYALDMDPIDLRIKNEPTVHPERGVPYSDRRLVECFREGARRFGWERRPRVPGSLRDGRHLIGYGVAAAFRGHFQAKTEVRVKLDPAGNATVESDMTEIGNGTYTVLAQVVAQELGIPIERVTVDIGRSEFPTSAGSGGSWGATNSCSAAADACRKIREKLNDGGSGPDGITATGFVRNAWEDDSHMKNALYTYGAHFVETRVDIDTGEVRLQRMLGVFAAGRILNPPTARSQLIGAMIWGVSSALFEEGVVDPRSGAFINRDFAQYLVPAHADVPELDAIVLDGYDDKANVLGAKGIGELGICGSGAAVGNAVFNATGIRVREFPITIEKLLPGLP